MSKSKREPAPHVVDKESAEYLQGRKDAGILIKMGLSLWLISNMGGMGRKHPTQSHKKLFAYCEGYNDRIAKEAKKKGITIPVHSAFGLAIFSQEDIGK